MTTILCAIFLASALLWAGCFGVRRAAMQSQAMEADIRRVFEGTQR